MLIPNARLPGISGNFYSGNILKNIISGVNFIIYNSGVIFSIKTKVARDCPSENEMRDAGPEEVHLHFRLLGEEQLKFITSVIVAGRTRTWVLGYWHVIMISYFRLDECAVEIPMGYAIRDAHLGLQLRSSSYGCLRPSSGTYTLPTSYQGILHLL